MTPNRLAGSGDGLIRERDIDASVSIEISNRNSHRLRSRRVPDRGGEVARSISVKKPEAVRCASERKNQIWFSVAVQVSGHKRGKISTR